MTDIKPDVVVTDLPSPAPDDPLEALSWLGETVEEVAEGLRARGIKGQLGEPQMCPLHYYLAEFGWNYSVAGDLIREVGSLNWQKAPYVFAKFVSKFDSGDYPDLIADNG